MMYVRQLFEQFTLKQLLAGGAALLAIALLLDTRGFPSLSARADAGCQTPANPQRKLSPEQIGKLLTIPQGTTKATVKSILKEPYCVLAPINVRAGTRSDREAYLVSADDFVSVNPKTQLVVLYEGDQYEGFRFLVR